MANNTFISEHATTFIGSAYSNQCFADIRDGESASQPGSIILPFGPLPAFEIVGSSGTEKRWYLWLDAHPVLGGHYKLRTNGRGYPATKSQVFIDDPSVVPQQTFSARFATVAGDMDGVSVNGSTEDWQVRCYYTNTSSRTIKARYRFFHRNTSGGETLLQVVDSDEISTTIGNYASVGTFTASWSANELLVIGLWVLNEGVPL